MVVGSPRARLRLIVLLLVCVVGIGLVERSLVGGVQAVIGMASGRILPVYSVESPQKRIAISFDATWGADTTQGLLKTLDQYGVKTTFFLAGYWLEKYPEMVKEIADRGHELGNHSYSHPHCNSLSAEEIRHELEQTNALIKSISGQDCRLFRPPFGEYNNTVVATANEAGYEAIMWDVDSLDWRDLSADEIVRRVMARVKPGSIVLFHNAGSHTGEALGTILREVRADGYEIVPVSQLLLQGETYIDHTGRQRPKGLASGPSSKGALAQQTVSTWSSEPWSRGEGGDGFAAVEAVVSAGVSKVVTDAGYTTWYRGDPEGKRVAFAMNVAWGEEFIPGILQALEARDTKVTFYFVGTWVRMFPELTQEISRGGHEVASHGFSHSHPTRIAQAELQKLLVDNRDLLRETIGKEPSSLFSPPYGEIDDRVTDTAGRLGLVTTMWTVDTIDWQRPPSHVIVERVTSKLEGGAIILMHPTAPTLEALPILIDELHKKGYKVVPVSELLS